MKCHPWILLTALGLFLNGIDQARAGVLYSQPTNLDGSDYSQNDTTPNGFGNYATVYDNFTLTTTATVNAVQWTGQYLNPANPGNLSGFTLTFWSDLSGQPGSALLTENISGTANQTSIGNDLFGNPTYTYNSVLPISFNANAGTQYWVSIVADLPFPPQWGWENGTGGDGIAYDDFFGTRHQLTNDLAFTLDGTPVPEPASAALLALGSLLGIGFMRRRRR